MGRQLRDLKEADLADLIVWLERRFPQEPEAEPVGVRPIDSSISFRTFVLRRLTEYGTPAAVEALRSTMTRLPKLTWLRHHIREAEEHARRRAWGPPAPAHLLAAIADRDRRLIQDGSQLLDVLNESLERAEAELQGELPAAELLWDATLEARGRPKAEDSLSNYLARHLKRDLVDRGVVTNREVEVRHGRSGRGRGHSTDIYVNALAPGGGADTLEPLRAVIEVKGCWHRELLKAMQTQLVERYMQPARIQHGLYLVGWYVCDWWDPGDPRRSQVPEMSLEELRKKIASQAADLTRKHGTDVRGVVLNVART
jgi:hypothetical protein